GTASSSGAGVDCKQTPSGGSMNTCSSSGVYSTGCATVGDTRDSTYPQTTWLTQCCTHQGSGVQPAKKACRYAGALCAQNSDCATNNCDMTKKQCVCSTNSDCGTSNVCTNARCFAVSSCGTGGGSGCAVCYMGPTDFPVCQISASSSTIGVYACYYS